MTSRPSVVDSARIDQLAREVERLNQRVAELAKQLATRDALVAQNVVATTVERCSESREVLDVSSTVSIEVELRAAQRALARVVERLDVTSDVKRELSQSLKPVRSLDTENPWVATK